MAVLGGARVGATSWFQQSNWLLKTRPELRGLGVSANADFKHYSLR